MSIKTILATAFAMFMMANISTAMAAEHVNVCHDGKTISIDKHDLQDHLDNGDSKGSCEDTNSNDSTPNVAKSVCQCGAPVTDLEKKAEKADKDAAKADDDAAKADKDAADADKYYEKIKDDDSYSDTEKEKAKEDKNTADEDKKTKDEDKNTKDDDKNTADEAAKNEFNLGACICPNGSTSYNRTYNVVNGAGAGAPTSAFREVRGQ